MPSYTTLARPSVQTYGSISQADYTIDLLFQDSVNYFFQDGVQKVFDGSDSNYTDISRSIDPSYGSISRAAYTIFDDLPFFSPAYFPFLDTGRPFERLGSYKPSQPSYSSIDKPA